MLTVFKRRSRRWTQNRRQKSCRVHYSQIPSFFPNKIFPGFIKIPPLPQSSDPSSSSIFASQRLSKMASQLKVDELREELAKRGLSTTGTKPTLVWTLELPLFLMYFSIILQNYWMGKRYSRFGGSNQQQGRRRKHSNQQRIPMIQ